MEEDKQEIEDIVKCTECNSRNLEEDDTRGELTCTDCGLVLDDNIIDQGKEWRVYSGEEKKSDPSRVGAPMSNLLHDKGLSTEIDWQNKDWSGKTIRGTSQMYRMRKWQKRARVSNSRERNLSVALGDLERMSGQMGGLPKSVKQEAANIYRKTLDAGLVRGRSITGAVAASVYISCQVCGIPRTLDEVATKLRLGRKEIGRTVRTIKRTLKMKPVHAKAEDYFERFCSDLGLPPKTVSKCHEWIQVVRDKELDSGRGPVGIAAALIYMASIHTNHRRTQREIADATNVTEVTIRNRYKELTAALDLELDI